MQYQVLSVGIASLPLSNYSWDGMNDVKKQECEPKENSCSKPFIYTRHEHQISSHLIDPDALKILYRLQRFGFKAYLVGGSVRDLLLNKRPKDFDIATNATPRQVKELFRNSRIIGRRFKLVHVVFRGQKTIEVSTFRDASSLNNSDQNNSEDIRPIMTDNTYGNEETDAVRRDITINALFLDPKDMSIIDYVGGINDIRDGVVRVIGNPDIRFAEDPVRLIRVIRHAARAGFIVEKKTWASIVKNTELIRRSSTVRVYEEVKKDLLSGYSLGILRLLAKSNLLPLLFPALGKHANLLLSENSPLSNMLGRIDDSKRKGIEYNNATILSNISFFLRKPDSISFNILERFQDEEVIHEHVLKCFHGLAVPRKERERIDGILTLWFLLAAGSKRFHMRKNKEERDSLYDLLFIFDSHDLSLFESRIREEAIARNKYRNERRRKRLIRNG
ncbi:MAG: hypothetical protein GYA55_08665 [SAR324 cluster bacterium]|uniref:Polynucleotide adenylyltransferase n=1 Tax=SAR324 cluster bacterium TaxID=2024889 RepID=A0A7X9FSR8_9DELT|nr:hypothetical protein [SAR324 cluster bacterium]